MSTSPYKDDLSRPNYPEDNDSVKSSFMLDKIYLLLGMSKGPSLSKSEDGERAFATRRGMNEERAVSTSSVAGSASVKLLSWHPSSVPLTLIGVSVED